MSTQPFNSRYFAPIHAWATKQRTQASNTSQRLKKSKIATQWTNTTTPSLLDWALLGVVLLLCFSVFLYGDIRATFEHSFNFLDALFSGHLRSFYTLSIEHTSTGHPAVYDIPIYLIFGIWNLPTYIIHKITGFDFMTSTPAQLWLKAMVVLFAIMAAKQLIQLARDLGISQQRSQWVGFFFLSSMTVATPVFIIVQYDIILVLVLILAMRAWVQQRWTAFILWFMLANTLKLFAIFIFIPLLLLREKRLRIVFLQFCAGLVGLAICRLIYLGDPGYQAATGGFTTTMAPRLTATAIPWIGTEGANTLKIPFFIIFIVGITFFSYAKKTQHKKELDAFAIYFSSAVFLVFSMVVPLNPYWVILAAPFTVLILFLNSKSLMLNALLETGFGASILFLYARVGFSMYNADLFKYLLLPHLFKGAAHPKFATPNDFLASLGLGGGNSFVIGFMFACGLGLLIINYPTHSFIESMGQSTERIPRSLAWFRVLVIFLFSTLLMSIYFIPKEPLVYDSSTSTPVSGDTNILDPSAKVTETIELEQTQTIKILRVGFVADQVQWIDSTLVDLTLTDSQGNTVYSTQVPANSLKDGLNDFAMGDVVLQGGQPYTLTITSSLWKGGYATVQLNPDKDDFTTIENGKTVTGDVVMQLAAEPK